MKSGCGTTPPPTHTFTKMSYHGRPSQCGFYRTPRDRNGFPGRGATPFTQPLLESADSTNDQVLRLRLQSQVLLGRALEMENRRFQEEITNLRECMRNNNQPDGGVTPHPNGTHRSRSLADRIDGGQHQSPPHVVSNDRGRATITREDPSLPPTVVVRPVDIHPRFLPLGSHFQEGGTGGPMFSRPQDWSDAIHENPAVRPRGIRRWGSQLVNLDDLHVYLHIGQIIYGGNRPPGRHDPVDPQRPWKAIEAAFFQGTIAIILQPGVFRGIYEKLTPDQRAPYRQPFLEAVEDPNQLAPSIVVEHLVRSGIIESWLQLDTVVGYAQSYLRDWARHQTRITVTNNMGRLFFTLYPDDIPHPEDHQFVEDAMREDESWEENKQEATPVDEQEEAPMDDEAEMPMDEDEGEDEVPPLESVTPSTSEGTRRTMTPEDEKLDWGEEELHRPPQV